MNLNGLNDLYSAYMNKKNWSKNKTDLNGDGQINSKDLNYLNTEYKKLLNEDSCFDINGDGEFDYRDLFSFSTKMDIDGDGEVSKDEETFLKSIKSTLTSKVKNQINNNEELSIDDLLAFEEDVSKLDKVTATELKSQISSLEKTLIDNLNTKLKSLNYDLTNGVNDKTNSEILTELETKLSEFGANSNVVKNFLNTLKQKTAFETLGIDASKFPENAEITMLDNGGYTVRWVSKNAAKKSVTVLTYDADNKLISRADGSVTTTYSYDENGHLSSAVKKNSNGKVILNYLYTCDDNGNVISATVKTPKGVKQNETYTFTYDNNNVISAQEFNGIKKIANNSKDINLMLEEAGLTYINPMK